MLEGNFIYRGSALKIVSEYLYLGILFAVFPLYLCYGEREMEDIAPVPSNSAVWRQGLGVGHPHSW